MAVQEKASFLSKLRIIRKKKKCGEGTLVTWNAKTLQYARMGV